MAGSEQRPNDDVEGLGYRWNPDAEATDEEQAGDDIEGHRLRSP